MLGRFRLVSKDAMADSKTDQLEETYFSFLVRVWVIKRPGRERSIDSEIQLIQTGESKQFASLEDMFEFLKQQIRSV